MNSLPFSAALSFLILALVCGDALAQDQAGTAPSQNPDLSCPVNRDQLIDALKKSVKPADRAMAASTTMNGRRW